MCWSTFHFTWQSSLDLVRKVDRSNGKLPFPPRRFSHPPLTPCFRSRSRPRRLPHRWLRVRRPHPSFWRPPRRSCTSSCLIGRARQDRSRRQDLLPTTRRRRTALSPSLTSRRSFAGRGRRRDEGQPVPRRRSAASNELVAKCKVRRPLFSSSYLFSSIDSLPPQALPRGARSRRVHAHLGRVRGVPQNRFRGLRLVRPPPHSLDGPRLPQTLFTLPDFSLTAVLGVLTHPRTIGTAWSFSLAISRIRTRRSRLSTRREGGSRGRHCTRSLVLMSRRFSMQSSICPLPSSAFSSSPHSGGVPFLRRTAIFRLYKGFSLSYSSTTFSRHSSTGGSRPFHKRNCSNPCWRRTSRPVDVSWPSEAARRRRGVSRGR